MRPVSQKTDPAAWDKFTQVTNTTFPIPNLLSNATTATSISGGGAVTITPAYATATAPVSVKTLDRITVSAHGIYLYNDLPADFFNAYTTLSYGGLNIATPEDEGVLMIPFNLYPGTYQPSSHVNVSRAREFYFKYSSSVINSSTTGELSICASAINFLKNIGKVVIKITASYKFKLV